MTDQVTPTGVLLMAYGTPETLDDVEPYYTHIRGGRKPSPESVEHLRARYRIVGGRTPLLDVTRETAASLERLLDASAPGLYRPDIGMKHWHPYIGDVVPRIVADGVRRLIGLALAPHYSRMSIGTYQKAVEDAIAGLDEPIDFRMIESWHEQPLFRALIADRIQDGLREFPDGTRDEVTVLFSAHSLPERILTWDDPYPGELEESAAGIAELAGIRDWALCYQSAGKTPEPWLGPDVLDALANLAAAGKRYVLSVPFGFVADHLEVFYDIDHEAQAKARDLGITLQRTVSPNADPAFIAALAAIVREKDPWQG